MSEKLTSDLKHIKELYTDLSEFFQDNSSFQQVIMGHTEQVRGL